VRASALVDALPQGRCLSSRSNQGSRPCLNGPSTCACGSLRSRRFLLDDLRHDIRHKARLLQKQSGFAAAVLLMLALGIGGRWPHRMQSLVNSRAGFGPKPAPRKRPYVIEFVMLG
jgi:hypothetical protein